MCPWPSPPNKDDNMEAAVEDVAGISQDAEEAMETEATNRTDPLSKKTHLA